MHISPAICRIGRVPSREAFRGSVITCSRNNERLILSSWLATPSSSSLSLSLSSVLVESARSVTTYRPFAFVSLSTSTSPLIVRPFVLYSRAPLFYTFLPLVVSANIRSYFEDVRYRFVFVCGFEYASIAVGRYGSDRQTGEAWEAALLKYSISEYRR